MVIVEGIEQALVEEAARAARDPDDTVTVEAWV